jgi:hypothetical protein
MRTRRIALAVVMTSILLLSASCPKAKLVVTAQNFYTNTIHRGGDYWDVYPYVIAVVFNEGDKTAVSVTGHAIFSNSSEIRSGPAYKPNLEPGADTPVHVVGDTVQYNRQTITLDSFWITCD